MAGVFVSFGHFLAFFALTAAVVLSLALEEVVVVVSWVLVAMMIF